MTAVSQEALIQGEVDRLTQIYPFSEEVAYSVASVAASQRSLTFDQLLRRIDPPETTIYTPDNVNQKNIEVSDIIPRNGYEDVVVNYCAMGTSLDAHVAVGIFALSEALPNSRIITIGSPGAGDKGTGALSIRDAKEVWDGRLRPLVHPVLCYLDDQGIERAAHVGYSFGAEKVAEAIRSSARFSYDTSVTRGVFMEPVTVKQRSLYELAEDFGSCADALEAYVRASDSKALNETNFTSAFKSLRYKLGLLKISNLAISHALTKNIFETRVNAALSVSEETSAAVFWGSESELAVNGVMQQIVGRLGRHYGDRFAYGVVEGGRHAMGDDIFLGTALTLQGLAA